MQENIWGKDVDVVAPVSLYKWAKIWGKVQKNYYPEPVHLRREKQIEDFVALNEFKKLYIEKDTDILHQLSGVPNPSDADLVIITDQKFSRLPCKGIIQRLHELLTQCPKVYVCLNRHYINIDNSYCAPGLSSHFPLAITQWLKSSLPTAQVIDMSLDVLDCGDWFTWVIPDRMYYIQQV